MQSQRGVSLTIAGKFGLRSRRSRLPKSVGSKTMLTPLGEKIKRMDRL